ncbi:MAG: thioredoxin [Clostridia bacterium]|nr:thioredoxin [Clostridia bacterium]MBR3806429.1 thioredoxin [Clostridia bacterium]
MSAIKIKHSDFEKAINKGVALIDFYADWCGACKTVSPIVDQVAKERADVLVGKVNIGDDPALASQYGIRSIPTLILFNDGVEVKRLVGSRPKAAILAELQ